MPCSHTLSSRRHWLAALLMSCTALAAIAQSTQTSVRVQDAWARPTGPGQTVGGGYLRIVGGAAADRLLSVRSTQAGMVELHSMAMDGDVMRMRQLDSVDIPAGQAIDLKPGGMHLMLMGLKSPLRVGSRVPLVLRFEKAGEVQVDMRVAAAQPAPSPAAARKP